MSPKPISTGAEAGTLTTSGLFHSLTGHRFLMSPGIGPKIPRASSTGILGSSWSRCAWRLASQFLRVCRADSSLGEYISRSP
ncbi:NADH:ubiquinone oxidoreductase subunit 5 /Multi-subunit Na+/H+ antiporter [Pseudomonas syringae pv. actinidiae]|uniref:NADH:ubiquinone oxidoreductase subunit 5 /Multi-subunit Na+/H+ antiporter n=1 Tax=Pseudomonas syringae pv. actinidiae TaxID=103796 RepID=A0A2V0QCV3_PSESF|nr:NADH:ubiquinone oxidoreductase subunit 5 /Multi-subunit Na+/H+ antiporter [Pseudomonas syringae pv. actinidiae]